LTTDQCLASQNATLIPERHTLFDERQHRSGGTPAIFRGTMPKRQLLFVLVRRSELVTRLQQTRVAVAGVRGHSPANIDTRSRGRPAAAVTPARRAGRAT
jgi:hypothetical protein